ncbi:MAG: hypothetical protein ACTSQE_11915 [Candidatus Heimdallarchaeaceae archaeon]
MESDTTQELLVKLIKSFKYYFISEAAKSTGKNILEINIDSVQYNKRAGRFGEVFVIDVFYSSKFGNHKSKVAIKFIEDPSDAMLEIKNTVYLEKKFSARSVVRIPRFIFVNLSNNPFIAYEGISGINYEEAVTIREKSFWAGYVLSIIHGGQTRPVMTDVYEEIFRRLVMMIYGGEEAEQEIMEKSKNMINMVATSQGGCDAFGDYHQSNLMLRTTANNEIVSIALIDPTFWMKGSYDRWEDVGTFFGRQSIIEYRSNRNLADTIEDVKQFIRGYNVHLREINVPSLSDIYPKGFPVDFYIAIWAMMDYIEKTVNQKIPITHPDIQLLKELAYILLTKQPVNMQLR